MNQRLASIALVVLVACAQAPTTPSFQIDVAPILSARCVRCHGFPAIGGAPPDFRLDGYPETESPSGQLIAGAGAKASLTAVRVAAHTMPPRFPLDDVQIDVLDNWVATGPALRGDPRPGNQRPTFALDSSTRIYELHDIDGDLVVGTLRATPAAGGPALVVANLHSGRDIVTFDPARFVPGTYELAAELDDGGETSVLRVGQIEAP